MFTTTTTTTEDNSSSSDWKFVVFHYVCPSLGVLISTALYMAPLRDLKRCLQKGTLGFSSTTNTTRTETTTTGSGGGAQQQQQQQQQQLNPVPWAVMNGNCLGWLIYAHLARDPFILASNLPGILVSTYLNIGASKLQYLQAMEDDKEEERKRNVQLQQQVQQQQQQQTTQTTTDIIINEDEDAASERTIMTANIAVQTKIWSSDITVTPQDKLWLQILLLWICIVVVVLWILPICFHTSRQRTKQTIGLFVNINLLFFYGAPLQTMQTVVTTRCSDSIHTPTVLLNCINAAFWAAYGIVAVHDVVVYGPNGLGLILGLIQAFLCCVYPKTTTSTTTVYPSSSSSSSSLRQPLLLETRTIDDEHTTTTTTPLVLQGTDDDDEQQQQQQQAADGTSY
ncbi:sugar efflux transporter [Nitzschia inconspicua]|uniref:Sugar efflux transporter n=1 Tax=Nitzschia inconspicua TaxID=303405 RepID=A0A9K3KC86_9STRA|nr:sugar efflux transporter [Nitzschia inconspicua]